MIKEELLFKKRIFQTRRHFRNDISLHQLQLIEEKKIHGNTPHVHVFLVISAPLKKFKTLSNKTNQSQMNLSCYFCEMYYCVKSIHIRSFSGPYFSAFGLNSEIYGVSLRIHSECGKIWTRKTPNADTFHARFSNITEG